MIRELVCKYDIGLADNFNAFRSNVSEPSDLTKYLSHVNHPSLAGHILAADEIAKYFTAK